MNVYDVVDDVVCDVLDVVAKVDQDDVVDKGVDDDLLGDVDSAATDDDNDDDDDDDAADVHSALVAADNAELDVDVKVVDYDDIGDDDVDDDDQ